MAKTIQDLIQSHFSRFIRSTDGRSKAIAGLVVLIIIQHLSRRWPKVRTALVRMLAAILDRSQLLSLALAQRRAP
jgi:hypothetical protein